MISQASLGSLITLARTPDAAPALTTMPFLLRPAHVAKQPAVPKKQPVSPRRSVLRKLPVDQKVGDGEASPATVITTADAPPPFLLPATSLEASNRAMSPSSARLSVLAILLLVVVSPACLMLSLHPHLLSTAPTGVDEPKQGTLRSWRCCQVCLDAQTCWQSKELSSCCKETHAQAQRKPSIPASVCLNPLTCWKPPLLPRAAVEEFHANVARKQHNPASVCLDPLTCWHKKASPPPARAPRHTDECDDPSDTKCWLSVEHSVHALMFF